MRSNPAAFALSLGMGLIVLLIGFLALNAAGLVSMESVEKEVATLPASGDNQPTTQDSATMVATAYKSVLPFNEATIAAGDALFKNNCAQCHAVNEKVVGPALAGITMRRQLPWITAWVHNSAKVIASGDEYAVKIYEANGKQQMPSFTNFSDKDVKAILTWIEAQQGQYVTSCLPPPVAAN